VSQRTPNRLRDFLTGFGIALIALVVLGVAAFFLLRGAGAESEGPAVIIRAPRFGQEVPAGETFIVSAIAHDMRGVTRIELWVDQTLVSVESSQLPEGSNPYPLAYGWYPETAGPHVLVVRALNRSGGSGQATVLVQAIGEAETGAQTSYLVAEGDTVAGIAERFGMAPEDIAAQNPGVSDPLSPGTTIGLSLPSDEPEGVPAEEPPAPEPLPGEEPPDPLPARELRPLDRLASLIPMGDRSEGTWIELEALSLEVDKAYDGVYCYYALADSPFERVPQDGFLAGVGERRWGIDEAMSGEHQRVVLLPEGSTSLEVRGECIGYRATSAGGQAFDLGRMTVNHEVADADGGAVLQEVYGRDGWFRVEYALHEIPEVPTGTPPRPGVAEEFPPGTLPAPSLTGSCDRAFLTDPAGWAVQCQVAWTVPADPRGVTPWVDGFFLLRNGALIETLPARGEWRKTLEGFFPAIAPTIIDDVGRATIAGDWGDLPPPGETYDFQVVYYQGSPFADPPAGYRSLPSNIFSLTGDMWPGSIEVTVTIQALHVICIWDDRDTIGLCTEGLGPRGWDSTGMPLGSCSYYCSGDPEDWGRGVYGGIDVNGERVLNIGYPISSGGRYNFPPSFGTRTPPTITLTLSPAQYLVIQSRMWDYDVFYHDDAFCHGTVAISASELQHIRDGAMPGFHVSEFSGGDGLCYLGYTVEVR
jgi:hypothetical protein